MPLIKSQNVPSTIAPFSLANIEAYAVTLLTKARKQADELLSAAQGEAEQLRRDAVAQGQADGRKKGLAQGLEEGKKSGHDQALNEHRQKLSAAVAALTQVCSQLETSRGHLQAEGLSSVIELAAAIARRVAKRQAELNRDVLMANLTGAMKLVCHWADVRIAVAPRELGTLRDELPNLQMVWPQLKHVELIEDGSLSPGGCRIFTANGSVDGDLDTQLDRVIDQILPRRE